MYIKLLGEDPFGRLPEGCTVGKVYELTDHIGFLGNKGFFDDDNEYNFAFSQDPERKYSVVGNWQVVDKEGNVL